MSADPCLFAPGAPKPKRIVARHECCIHAYWTVTRRVARGAAARCALEHAYMLTQFILSSAAEDTIKTGVQTSRQARASCSNRGDPHRYWPRVGRLGNLAGSYVGARFTAGNAQAPHIDPDIWLTAASQMLGCAAAYWLGSADHTSASHPDCHQGLNSLRMSRIGYPPDGFALRPTQPRYEPGNRWYIQVQSTGSVSDHDKPGTLSRVETVHAVCCARDNSIKAAVTRRQPHGAQPSSNVAAGADLGPQAMGSLADGAARLLYGEPKCTLQQHMLEVEARYGRWMPATRRLPLPRKALRLDRRRKRGERSITAYMVRLRGNIACKGVRAASLICKGVVGLRPLWPKSQYVGIVHGSQKTKRVRQCHGCAATQCHKGGWRLWPAAQEVRDTTIHGDPWARMAT